MHKFTWDYFNGYSDASTWWMVCFFRVQGDETGVFLHAIISHNNKIHKVVKMSRSCLQLLTSSVESQRYPRHLVNLADEIYATNDGEIQDNNFTVSDNDWEAWGNTCHINNSVASIHIPELLDLEYNLGSQHNYPSNTLTNLGVNEYTSYQRCSVTGKVLDKDINTFGWYDHEGGSSLTGIDNEGWTWLSLHIDNNNLCAYITPNITEGFMNNDRIEVSIQTLEEHYSLDGYFYLPTRLQVDNYEVRVINPHSTLNSLAILGTYFEGAVEVYENNKLVGSGFLEFVPKQGMVTSDPRKFFGSYQTYIGNEIANIYPAKLRELLPLDYYEAEVSELDISYINDPVRHVTDAAGGCWRSGLGMIICQMMTDNLEALNIIKAVQPYIEISQSASLMIDDIQDNSMYRRGKLCAYKVYGSEPCHMSGELTCFHYMDIIESLDITPDKKFKLAFEIMSSIKMLHLGQLADLKCSDAFRLIHDKPELLKRLTSINCMKTGIFTRMMFQLSIIIASWYEDIDESVIPVFAEMGMTLGLIYQGLNDLEDLDKKSGEDLRDNKVTTPMVLATTDNNMLDLITKLNKTPEDITTLLTHFRSNDVRGKTKQYINDIFNRSWYKFDRVTKPSVYKLQLRAFCNTLLECK